MTAHHAQLGTLIRVRRESAGLSQQALADKAGVSRESVNRLEKATGQWTPKPAKIAQVLSALDVHVPEITDVVSDPEMYVELVREMEKLATVEFSSYLDRTAPSVPSTSAQPDIVLISPRGVTAIVEVKGPAKVKRATASELGAILGDLGWTVTAPVH
jgi:transcriptional regulator with XRE-family HTH domain